MMFEQAAGATVSSEEGWKPFSMPLVWVSSQHLPVAPLCCRLEPAPSSPALGWYGGSLW